MDTSGDVRSRVLEAIFPELEGWDYSVTSENSHDYNCIAWAAGEDARQWWPWGDDNTYWPSDAPCELSLDAFVKAYASIRYEVCDDEAYDPEYDKVALFADPSGCPTHAALQIDDLYWTSKLGKLHDIRHPLRALDGGRYGRVKLFMRRRKAG